MSGHGATSTQTKKSNVLRVVLLLVALLLTVSKIRESWDAHKGRQHTQKNEGVAAATTSPDSPPPRAPANKVVKVGCVTAELRFADYPRGEIVRYITSHDFRIYPKGGCVRASPKEGVWYVDCPGLDVPKEGGTTSYGPGKWRWRKKDKSSIGVDVCE